MMILVLRTQQQKLEVGRTTLRILRLVTLWCAFFMPCTPLCSIAVWAEQNLNDGRKVWMVWFLAAERPVFRPCVLVTSQQSDRYIGRSQKSCKKTHRSSKDFGPTLLKGQDFGQKPELFASLRRATVATEVPRTDFVWV